MVDHERLDEAIDEIEMLIRRGELERLHGAAVELASRRASGAGAPRYRT